MEKESKYPYPVSEETIKKFTREIILAVNKKQSLTYSFAANMGGERSWIKFILNSPSKTDLHSKLKHSKLCYFEPSDIVEYSKLGFFFELLKSINPDVKIDYNQISLYTLIDIIKGEISSELKRRSSIVIFIAKLDSFLPFSYEYGNLLYSIWKDHKENISFITTIAAARLNNYLTINAGEFKEILNQNIKEIHPLKDSDILYSIKHWEELLGVKLSTEVIENIVKYSRGSPYISKALTQAVVREKKLDPKSLKKLLLNIVKTQFKSSEDNYLTIVDENIKLGENNISMMFTTKEIQIISHLVKKQNKTVTRDELAKTIWGDQSFDRYSDWAIDKFISVIRSKLEQQYFSGELKTLRGKGFKLIQAAAKKNAGTN